MKKQLIVALLLAFIAMPVLQAQWWKKKKKEKAEVKLENSVDSASYCLGVLFATNLKSRPFIPNMNNALFIQALQKSLNGDSMLFDAKTGQQFMQMYLAKAEQAKADSNSKKGTAFLENNKKKSGVITLPSGLQYEVIKDGDGPMPAATDTILAHYHGTFIDGKVFDSSIERGEPLQIRVNQVIPGWTEALEKMKVGSKWKLFIPSELGYGANPPQGMEPNSVLIFEVELLKIVHGEQPKEQKQ
jgi:FKBP-type peptidyl-prolyl cis-trans isomerase FklB